MAGHDITNLLEAIRGGDRAAGERLYARVHEELRAMAAARARRERAALDAGATALVQEAYLKLAGREGGFENRRHFFGAAARAMHQVLIDRAREAAAGRRGGGRRRVDLDDALRLLSAAGGGGSTASEGDACDWDGLHAALAELEAMDEREAEVVRMRVFCGVPISEVAKMLGVTGRTVERDWQHARAWLADRLGGRAGAKSER